MYRQDEPEINLEQLLERLRNFTGRFRLGGGGGNGLSLIIFAIFGVALLIWLGTGFYTVDPGEQAALRRVGKFDNTQGPGLHWFWPAPRSGAGSRPRHRKVESPVRCSRK